MTRKRTITKKGIENYIRSSRFPYNFTPHISAVSGHNVYVLRTGSSEGDVIGQYPFHGELTADDIKQQISDDYKAYLAKRKTERDTTAQDEHDRLPMNLTDAIDHAAQLDYDTLRDVRDLLEFQSYDDRIQAATDERQRENLRSARNRIKLRIRGRHSTPDGGGKTWEQIRYPADLATVPTMDRASRDALLATVKALIQAKQPMAAQRTKADGSSVAKGSFQTKTKKNAYIERDHDGEILRDADGNAVMKDAHYLYFRLYVTNHDGTKRSASIYIGSLTRQEPKPFLAAVQNGDITPDDLVKAFQEGGYEAVKAWRNSMDEGVN